MSNRTAKANQAVLESWQKEQRVPLLVGSLPLEDVDLLPAVGDAFLPEQADPEGPALCPGMQDPE